MKQWLVVALVVLSAGCGSQPANDETEQTVNLAAEREAAAELATMAAEGQARERAYLIEDLRAALGRREPLEGWTVYQVLNWDLVRFDTMRYGFVQCQPEGDIPWEALKASRDEATQEFRRTGLRMARNLVAVLGRPIEERYAAGDSNPGNEGRWPFTDSADLMEKISDTLGAISAEPKDIGQTRKGLRSMLVRDLREYFAWTVDHPEQISAALSAMRRAKERYGVTNAELFPE